MGRIRTTPLGGVRLPCAAAALAFACPLSARAVIQFDDVSPSSGITYVGKSWGSAWTDFDGDGYPDFWLVDHQNAPSLYRNQGDGTFVDIAGQVIEAGTQLVFDAHGAIWGDFDNDGDPDLYQLADEGPSGPIPDRFFYNDAGILRDRAAQLGLDYTIGRGRMPLWMDYDRDGLLDVLHPTVRHLDGTDGPTALFHQEAPGSFVDVADVVGLVPNTNFDSHFALLGDMTGDGTLELLTSRNRFPEQVYDMATVPFTDVRATVGIATQCCVIDAVVADLDGDLDNDFFMTSGEQAEDFVQNVPDTVEAHLTGVTETGLQFGSTGDVTVALYPFWTTADVFIGTAGTHPAALPFTVSAADSTTWGIYPHTPDVDVGIYVGYDDSTGTWQILRTGGEANLVITSPQPLTGTAGVNWSRATEYLRPDRYLVNLGGSFVDRTSTKGFSIPSSARSVVAADFDNDMDLDLYVVSTGPVENLPNIMYENQGDGSFVALPNGAGAAGNSLGRGEAATVADYDLDGFLDLLVTNGTSKAPFDLDGPTFLFHNLGGSNHWIELDLVGVHSNRDGVGCQLLLTAGGVTQLREQNGGIHYRGQNFKRIHFGLGTNDVVDELTIHWPSGIDQVVTGLPADQIIQITEPDVTGAEEEAGAPAVDRPLASFPNPFRIGTTLSFSLARAEPVTLTVHDAAGRLVRRLLSGELRPAGPGRVTWSGRDAAGRRVASGVYFVRLQAGARTATTRVVLLD